MTTLETTKHDEWREQRTQYVSGPTGNIALVEYVPVTSEPTKIDQLGVCVQRDGDGVLVDPAEGVTLDKAPINEQTHMSRLRPDGTPLLSNGRFTADAFSLDGSDFEMRVYDAQAERLADFGGIDCYPYSPELVVPARFEKYDETTSVAWDFTRSTDSGHGKKVPGEVVFSMDGETYRLLAFLDGSTLVVTFADATTGAESYPPGRFLRLDDPAEDGTMTIDFNYAFIPPCGFSTFYSCPLPPPQNRIAAPIRGGEKKVLWKNEDDA